MKNNEYWKESRKQLDNAKMPIPYCMVAQANRSIYQGVRMTNITNNYIGHLPNKEEQDQIIRNFLNKCEI